MADVPPNGSCDCLFEAPHRSPAQSIRSLVDAELQYAVFVWSNCKRVRNPSARTPGANHGFNQIRNGKCLGCIRTKIPACGELPAAITDQRQSQRKITRQWFEDVLPGADSARRADREHFV